VDAIWTLSPEKRGVIQRELNNWGAWSRQGSGTGLGYSSPKVPERSPGRSGAGFVSPLGEMTEKVISTWSLSSPRGKRFAFVLKLCYVENLPLESITVHYNRKFGTRKDEKQLSDLLDQAEYGYWLLTSG